ncbi:MAG: C1 family peptidase [Rhodothermia bacterium]|nr:C1 family peptidase [Rhodothermia bacterium]
MILGKKIFCWAVIILTTTLEVNLLFSQGLVTTKLSIDSYQRLPQKISFTTRSGENLPKEISLRPFAPTPGDQGEYETCTAWSAAHARVILEAQNRNWRSPNVISREMYNAGSIYRLSFPADETCSQGGDLVPILETLKNVGAPRMAEIRSDCPQDHELPSIKNWEFSKLEGYARLFDINERDLSKKVGNVKKSLAQKYPVMIGMSFTREAWESLRNYQIGAWKPVGESGTIGHAMTVVGYNDTKDGGVFEIMNSWGTAWGDKGFWWIKYDDFAHFTDMAIELIPKRNHLPTPTKTLSGSFRVEDRYGRVIKTISNKKYGAPRLSRIIQSHYRTEKPIPQQLQYRLVIENSEPAFVYAIGSDLRGEITKLFPYEENIDPYMNYKSFGELINETAIPSEKHVFEASDFKTTDYFIVLYSTEKLDFDAIMSLLKQEKTGTISEKLNRVLLSRRIPDAKIEYSQEKISFRVKSNEQGLVVLILEMEVE